MNTVKTKPWSIKACQTAPYLRMRKKPFELRRLSAKGALIILDDNTSNPMGHRFHCLYRCINDLSLIDEEQAVHDLSMLNVISLRNRSDWMSIQSSDERLIFFPSKIFSLSKAIKGNLLIIDEDLWNQFDVDSLAQIQVQNCFERLAVHHWSYRTSSLSDPGEQSTLAGQMDEMKKHLHSLSRRCLDKTELSVGYDTIEVADRVLRQWIFPITRGLSDLFRSQLWLSVSLEGRRSFLSVASPLRCWSARDFFRFETAETPSSVLPWIRCARFSLANPSIGHRTIPKLHPISIDLDQSETLSSQCRVLRSIERRGGETIPPFSFLPSPPRIEMDCILADRSIVRASPADTSENAVHRIAFGQSPIIVVNGQKRREKKKGKNFMWFISSSLFVEWNELSPSSPKHDHYSTWSGQVGKLSPVEKIFFRPCQISLSLSLKWHHWPPVKLACLIIFGHRQTVRFLHSRLAHNNIDIFSRICS